MTIFIYTWNSQDLFSSILMSLFLNTSHTESVMSVISKKCLTKSRPCGVFDPTAITCGVTCGKDASGQDLVILKHSPGNMFLLIIN